MSLDIDKALDVASGVSDILLLSIIVLQLITNKSRTEVLEAIKDEGTKTDELLKKLR